MDQESLIKTEWSILLNCKAAGRSAPTRFFYEGVHNFCVGDSNYSLLNSEGIITENLNLLELNAIIFLMASIGP